MSDPAPWMREAVAMEVTAEVQAASPPETESERTLRHNVRRRCPLGVCMWVASGPTPTREVIEHMAFTHPKELAVDRMLQVVWDVEGRGATLDDA